MYSNFDRVLFLNYCFISYIDEKFCNALKYQTITFDADYGVFSDQQTVYASQSPERTQQDK